MNGSIPPSIAAIQQATAKHFHVRVHDILSQRRARKPTWARHVAMYLCRELTGHSMPVIGRHFGDRDHTSVMYAIRKVEERVKDCGRDREDVADLMETVRAPLERLRPATGSRRGRLDVMGALLARRAKVMDEIDAIDRQLDEYGYGIWGSDDEGTDAHEA